VAALFLTDVTERSIDIFFYGLFMDMALLEQRGLHPSDPRLAYLDGYSIGIFDRATLIRNTSERVYGVVAGLNHEEIHILYSDASVQDYRPEAVLVTLKNNSHVPALCYNLPKFLILRQILHMPPNFLSLQRNYLFPKPIWIKFKSLLFKAAIV
jgi:hypothetical protein